MSPPTPFGVILAAIALDLLVGDPDYRWHPIRLLGAASIRLENRLFARGYTGHLGGIGHWLLVVGGALAVWWLGHRLSAALDPRLAWLWDGYLAFSLLCSRALIGHGQRVLRALDDLPLARRELGYLVSRDTERLDRAGCVRATIESLAENLTDAVLTPLWALCLFGLPGLIVVKAISSLDSMVGYRTTRYRRFGWLAARSDDLIHWLPARLSPLLIALAAWLTRLPVSAIASSVRRNRNITASPNSGWSEAAYAGALRVRLVGPVHYREGHLDKPFMGDPQWPAELDAADLRRALQLTWNAALLASSIGLVLLIWRAG